MKTKAYPLLQFRDKVQSANETIFPTLITIDKIDFFDPQNVKITTGRGKNIKISYRIRKSSLSRSKKNSDPKLDSRSLGLGNPPPIQKQSNINYRKEKTNINSLENFVELVENDIFKPKNYRRIKNNISNQERNALKDIQKDTSKTCRIQDKGSRFVVLDSDSHIEKTDRQLEISSRQQSDYHPSDEFCKRVTS